MQIWLTFLLNLLFFISVVIICEYINKCLLKRRIIKTIKKEFPNATVQVKINMIPDVEFIVIKEEKINE